MLEFGILDFYVATNRPRVTAKYTRLIQSLFAFLVNGHIALNAVKYFFDARTSVRTRVAEVVRLRAMPETTKFSRIRLPKSLTALPNPPDNCG